MDEAEYFGLEGLRSTLNDLIIEMEEEEELQRLATKSAEKRLPFGVDSATAREMGAMLMSGLAMYSKQQLLQSPVKEFRTDIEF